MRRRQLLQAAAGAALDERFVHALGAVLGGAEQSAVHKAFTPG